MHCPSCNSITVWREDLPTGDWEVRFACGSSLDDNGLLVKTKECIKNAAKALVARVGKRG